MHQLILLHQNIIRTVFFLSILIIMMLWEKFLPRRPLSVSRKLRWPSNLAIIVLNSILVRLLFPVVAIGAALTAQTLHIGLFNNLNIHFWFKVIFSVIFLDLVIYFQHIIFHVVPIFWRIHRMHHTDLDIDITTGIRFHPIEILLSMLIKIGAVFVFGAPIIAVLIFEILLNATSMFNHGNVYIPKLIDKLLRCFIVTPDMHRVHHSVIIKETNSNYGFNLSCWDRLFRTYRPQPEKGHLNMTIGLSQFRKLKYLNIHWLIAIPFLK